MYKWAFAICTPAHANVRAAGRPRPMAIWMAIWSAPLAAAYAAYEQETCACADLGRVRKPGGVRELRPGHGPTRTLIITVAVGLLHRSRAARAGAATSRPLHGIRFYRHWANPQIIGMIEEQSLGAGQRYECKLHLCIGRLAYINVKSTFS